MPDATPLPESLRRRAFAVADARSLGVPLSRLRARDLHTPFRGVRTPQVPATLVERCRAYAAGCSDGIVFCGPTAARLLGIPLPARFERAEELHVLQRWTDRAPRGPGIVGHKTRHEIDLVTLAGLRCTAPVPTWFALGALLAHDDLVIAGDAMVGGKQPLIGVADLRTAVRSHTRARGAARIREAFDEVRAGAWSPRETQVRLALVRGGLPEPELNAPIDVAGRRYHGDLVYRRQRLLLEYEGRQHYTDARQWSHDLERYNAFAEESWTVLRIAHELPLPTLVARVRRILAR